MQTNTGGNTKGIMRPQSNIIVKPKDKEKDDIKIEEVREGDKPIEIAEIVMEEKLEKI